MKNFTELERETAAVQLGFLLADLATANTFLDVAGTTTDMATRKRNIGHANTAHAAVSRFTPRVKMNLEQSADVHHKLDLLRGRITSMELAEPQ